MITVIQSDVLEQYCRLLVVVRLVVDTTTTVLDLHQLVGLFDNTKIALKSVEHTALREAREEVGVDAAQVQVLGRLSSLYIPVSNFLVHPYVGWLDEKPDLTPEESEVAEILEIPLPHLQRNKTIGETSIQVGEDLTIDNVPYYDLFGHVLWGATAMMTSELLDIVPIMRES